jgi:hypothetical protein
MGDCQTLYAEILAALIERQLTGRFDRFEATSWHAELVGHVLLG